MASKRSKARMQAQLPPMSRTSSSTSSLQGNNSVHITTFVNEGESIEELFQPGRSERIYERARPMNRGPLPPSFHSPLSIRQRGSSAGHSPQGSSDDGFSTSRNTLSPSSFNEPVVLQTAPMQPSSHKKLTSAPELNHRGNDSFVSASRSVASFAPAPLVQPIASQHVYSKSVSAIDQSVAFPPVSHHVKSTSYDANHLAAPYPAFHGMQQTHSQQELYHPSTQQREKSQSLDHITIAHNQSQMNNYDSLPPNWSYGYSEQGDVYFIDHENQKTTWFDPRLPRHEQEEAIMARHSNQPLDARMQQLQMERSGMHERQQELARMGLIPSDRGMYMQQPSTAQQQHQPQQFQQHVNNNVNNAQMHQFYTQQPTTMHMRQQQQPMNHARTISDESSMMDFDYTTPEAYTRDIPNFESEELNMYLGGMQM